MDIISTIILKRPLDDFPGPAVIVLKKAGNVFKDEDFGAAFFHNTSELTEQRASCVIETAPGANEREGLARCSSDKQVYLIPEWLGVELINVIVPPCLFYIIICEIGPFSVGLNVSSEKYLRPQPQTLERVLNGADSAE